MIIKATSLYRVFPSLLLACFAGFISVPGLASAQGNPCDPGLQPAPGNKGYLSRSGRCEGLYVSPVSAPSLALISLLRGKLRYDLQPSVQLILSAPDVADIAPGPVHVRAVARPVNTYYRMDAVLPATRQLAWAVEEVLLPLRLAADKLGVFGWVEKGTEKIFVPLHMAPPGGATREGAIECMVRPTVAIDRIVWRASPEGGLPAVPFPWQDAATRVAAGQPVTISLPEGPRALVRVEVKAKVSESDRWLELVFRVVRDAL